MSLILPLSKPSITYLVFLAKIDKLQWFFNTIIQSCTTTSKNTLKKLSWLKLKVSYQRVVHTNLQMLKNLSPEWIDCREKYVIETTSRLYQIGFLYLWYQCWPVSSHTKLLASPKTSGNPLKSLWWKTKNEIMHYIFNYLATITYQLWSWSSPKAISQSNDPNSFGPTIIEEDINIPLFINFILYPRPRQPFCNASALVLAISFAVQDCC